MTSPSYYKWRLTQNGIDSTLELILVSGDGAEELAGTIKYVGDSEFEWNPKCESRMIAKYGELFPRLAKKKANLCLYPYSIPRTCCNNCWKIDFPGVTNIESCGLGEARTFYLVNRFGFGRPDCWKSSVYPNYNNVQAFTRGVASLQWPSTTSNFILTAPTITIYWSNWKGRIPGVSLGVPGAPDGDLTQGGYIYDPSLNGGRDWNCTGGVFKLYIGPPGGPSNEGDCNCGWPETITLTPVPCDIAYNRCDAQTAFWQWFPGIHTWRQIIPCPDCGGLGDTAPTDTPGYAASREIPCS